MWGGAPESNDQCPYEIPEGDMYRGDHVVMEAELRAMLPPAKDHLESPEAGQGQVEHLDHPQGSMVC